MSDVAASPRITPWHFWLVAGVAMLWNAFGGFDFVMSQLQGETYYQQVGMSQAQIAYMATYPGWMHGVWALGVGGAVAGSVLLLLRSRFALHAFGLSFVGVVVSNGYALISPEGRDVMGVVMPAAIATVAVFLIGYAWAMTRKGILR